MRACMLMFLSLAACGAAGEVSQSPEVAGPELPTTRVEDVVDDYHGTKVADPYRWLEDQDSEEVLAWAATQNEYARHWLDDVPEREALRARLTELWSSSRRTAPLKAGERWIYRRNSGTQNQDVLMLADTRGAEGRVLIDPNDLSADGTTSLGAAVPSKDGRYLAYATSDSGSDWQTWRVMVIDDNRVLDDVLPWSKFSGAAWHPDGTGFFYQRYPEPEAGKVYEAETRRPALCFHRLGSDPAEDRVVYERPDKPTWGFSPYVTEDGGYLIVTIWEGTDSRTRVGYVDLKDESMAVKPLLMEFDAEWDFLGNNDNLFYFRTSKNAQRGRILALEVNPGADPEEGADPQEIVAEADDALQAAWLSGDHLVLLYLRDASHRLVVRGRDGSEVREIELPTLGQVSGVSGRQGDNLIYYTFQSFNMPPTLFSHDLASGAAEAFFTPETPVDPAAFEVQQVFVQADDGTRIPMFLVHKPGIALDGSHRTYLYGYGGFNISLTPSFSAANAAWVEQGGIFAMAILRGGGEYGEAWHEAGMLGKKQNVFDDFTACARYLVRNGLTSRERLAVGGRSNGGLLAAACLVQHPDMIGAAIPEVGVLDMLRYHKFTIGWAWVPEYGSADNPEQFPFLKAYSPLHNVEADREYPPTLVMTGDHDDRVLPGHSYKFAATLQRAQGGDDPILLRVETSAGHGAGKPVNKRIDEAVDRWAFLLKVLK